MPPSLPDITGSLTQYLFQRCQKDPELLRLVRGLAQAFLDFTAEQPAPTAETAPTAPAPVASAPLASASASPAAATPPAPAPARVSEPPAKPEPAPKPAVVKPAAASPVVVPSAPAAFARDTRPAYVETTSTYTPQETTDADLPLIEERMRLKAEGSRWAAQRQRLLGEGADYRLVIEPQDRDLIDRAKRVPDCFLWMNHPTGPTPESLDDWDQLAGCFDAGADAVRLVREVHSGDVGNRDDLERALELLAEAQSALRVAVYELGGRPDNDQAKTYNWLRGTLYRLQIFIPRYMRLEDPALPEDWAELRERVAQLSERLERGRQQSKKSQSAMAKLRYHLKAISDGRGEAMHDWEVVVSTIETLLSQGLSPSNVELRELLLPLIDRLPEGLESDGFSRVLREIDRFMASRTESREVKNTTLSADVAKVAELLRGKTVVLIGGIRRPDSHDALERAFELQNLDWVETREHESIAGFEPHVARANVAVVLLAIRWSSHSYGDVKSFCDRYGKPLVRLPAGYNPNQVAAQILTQVSARLAG